MNGNLLLQEPSSTFFAPTGLTSGGDVYVEFDPENGGHWYVESLNGNFDNRVAAGRLADLQPARASGTSIVVPMLGGFTDYPKLGYNHDCDRDLRQRLRQRHARRRDHGRQGRGAGRLAGLLPVDARVPVPCHARRPDQRRQPRRIRSGSSRTDGTDTSGNTLRVTRMDNPLSSSPDLHLLHGDRSASGSTPTPPTSRAAPGSVTDVPARHDHPGLRARRHRSRPRSPASTPTSGRLPARSTTTRSTSPAARRCSRWKGVVDPGPGVTTQIGCRGDRCQRAISA